MSGDREYGGWLPPTEGAPKTDPFGRELPRAEPAPDAPPEPSWGPGPSATGEIADYPSRMLAAVTDFVVRLAFVLAAGALGAIGYASSESTGETTLIAGLIAGWILSLLYAPIMIARTGGQTVGHRAANTRIVKMDGSPLGVGGAFVREVVVKLILFEVIGQFTIYLLTLANYLWPLWDEKNETLHDKVCSTRVVRA